VYIIATMLIDWQRLQAEVLRVHTRYQVEVVEALNLCPWAQKARCSGRLNLQVSFVEEPEPAAVLSLLDALLVDPYFELGMLVFPALALDRLPFAHFLAEVRSLDDARAIPSEQRFAIADFHPNATTDDSTPERLVSLLRRTPDPMLQCVRSSVLARVRHADDHGTSYVDVTQLDLAALTNQPTLAPAAPQSLAMRIAHNNARSVAAFGVPELEALLSDIQRDRNVSYGSLGLNAPTWAYKRRLRTLNPTCS
jgi:hypothetical protein